MGEFIAGLFLGALIGFFAAALVCAARRGQDRDDAAADRAVDRYMHRTLNWDGHSVAKWVDTYEGKRD